MKFSHTPFFVIGNPRSGTTLLRVVLSSHSRIWIPPECGFAVWLYDRYANWSSNDNKSGRLEAFLEDLFSCRKFETWNLTRELVYSSLLKWKPCNYAQLVVCVYAIQGLQHKVSGHPQVLGDKNNFYLFHITQIATMFPAAKFIHIVRDVRDVVCSYLELSKKSIRSKYAPKLPGTVEKAAREWRENIRCIRLQFGLLDSQRVLQIRYEDVVRFFDSTIHRVCDFLGETYDPSMRNFAPVAKASEPAEFLAWKEGILGKLGAGSLNRFRNELTSDEIRSIEAACHAELTAYRYKLGLAK